MFGNEKSNPKTIDKYNGHHLLSDFNSRGGKTDGEKHIAAKCIVLSDFLSEKGIY